MSGQLLDILSVSDGEIRLELCRKSAAREGRLPVYEFLITRCCDGRVTGKIDLRIGMNRESFYNGNLGYATLPDYRGSGIMPRACRLCAMLALRHGMRELVVTTNIANESSKRVLEKVGARFDGTADVPEDHPLYRDGKRKLCVYRWDISQLTEEGTEWITQN